jgi:hypothetical protein
MWIKIFFWITSCICRLALKWLFHWSIDFVFIFYWISYPHFSWIFLFILWFSLEWNIPILAFYSWNYFLPHLWLISWVMCFIWWIKISIWLIRFCSYIIAICYFMEAIFARDLVDVWYNHQCRSYCLKMGCEPNSSFKSYLAVRTSMLMACACLTYAFRMMFLYLIPTYCWLHHFMLAKNF